MLTMKFTRNLLSLSKPSVARFAIMFGMTLLWVNVAQYLLGYGASPIIVGVVFGYGLTDKFIAAAKVRP
jgi:hypothetical protein